MSMKEILEAVQAESPSKVAELIKPMMTEAATSALNLVKSEVLESYGFKLVEEKSDDDSEKDDKSDEKPKEKSDDDSEEDDKSDDDTE